MASELRIPGLVVREHELEVPLDHAEPGGERITIFAREVAHPDGLDRPHLLFLQGGPGHEAPRPTGLPSSPGWLERALADFRVVMLDQRGTGRSSPVGAPAGGTPAEEAARLAHFRADAIVRDAEALRAALGMERWSVLGQSFGGFCVLAYLSQAPEGLREALITGGLPPLGPVIEDVYAATYARVAERTRAHLGRYPGDAARLVALARHVEAEEVRLPGGGRLTARGLRGLGRGLGMSDGSEKLHYLLELPPRSPAFLHDAEAALSFARNPLYAVLQEACWADGGTTGWAALRTLPEPGDDPAHALTGEHFFPWTFEDDPALAPWRDAAEVLAAQPWPRLYDPERLQANEVPAAAAIYVHDPYVPRAHSEATAARVRGLRAWVTSEYDHNGLRADGGRILGHLLDLARGRA